MTKVMFLTNDKSSGQQGHMGIFCGLQNNDTI
jgi:hypothetical protein